MPAYRWCHYPRRQFKAGTPAGVEVVEGIKKPDRTGLNQVIQCHMSEDIDRVWALMDKISFCMLSTHDGEDIRTNLRWPM